MVGTGMDAFLPCMETSAQDLSKASHVIACEVIGHGVSVMNSVLSCTLH